jgi:hypothetical protein
LDFRPNYRVHPAFGHTPSRLPTIHLSKNLINTAANQLRFGVVMSFAFHASRLSAAFAQGEADITVASNTVNRCREDFSQPPRPVIASPDTGRTELIVRPPALPSPANHLRDGGEKSTELGVIHQTPAGLQGSSLVSVATATSDPGRSTRRSSSTATRPTSCGRC